MEWAFLPVPFSSVVVVEGTSFSAVPAVAVLDSVSALHASFVPLFHLHGEWRADFPRNLHQIDS